MPDITARLGDDEEGIDLGWAWVESNYRPHAYQACALTGLSYRPKGQVTLAISGRGVKGKKAQEAALQVGHTQCYVGRAAMRAGVWYLAPTNNIDQQSSLCIGQHITSSDGGAA